MTVTELDAALRQARDERVGDPHPESYWPVYYRQVLAEVVAPLRRARNATRRHQITVRLGRVLAGRDFRPWLANGAPALQETERARLARELVRLATPHA